MLANISGNGAMPRLRIMVCGSGERSVAYRLRSMPLVAAALITGLAMSGCGEAPATPAATGKSAVVDFTLTAGDLQGAARLTRSERRSFIDACIFGISSISEGEVAKKKGSVSKSDLQEMRHEVGQLTPRFCECFTDAYEDRASKLQVVMLATAFRLGHKIGGKSIIPELTALRLETQKHGMSNADWAKARKVLQDIGKAAGDHCIAKYH